MGMLYNGRHFSEHNVRFFRLSKEKLAGLLKLKTTRNGDKLEVLFEKSGHNEIADHIFVLTDYHFKDQVIRTSGAEISAGQIGTQVDVLSGYGEYTQNKMNELLDKVAGQYE